MNNLKFSNFNDGSNEGKLLLSALSILTCNKFNYKGNEINGSKHTPDEIFEILKNLSEDIYKDEIKKDNQLKEKSNDNSNEIPDKYGYKGFFKDAENIINSNCIENFSNTPDFILAEFLTDSLKSVEKLMNSRDKWYSFNPWAGNIIDCDKFIERDKENDCQDNE